MSGVPAYSYGYPTRPRPSPIYRKPPSFCAMILQMVQQNPYMIQVLRQRPDLLHMIRNRCGGLGVGYRMPPRRHTYPRGRPNTLPPYPQPPTPPRSGCGYGKRFDSCGCRCVPKDAITPQCIRDCTQCGVDDVFNWCVMRCVPKTAKIKQCPPLI